MSDGLLFDAGLFLSAPGAGLIPNNPPIGHLLFNSIKYKNIIYNKYS